VYYEEAQTGSIYSVRELITAARREHIPLEELAKGVKQLPYSTVLLIEEAETIASNARDQQERAWLDRLWD
jgi:hypothetical protein